MRTPLMLALLLLTGCDPEAPCRSLQLGQSIASLPTTPTASPSSGSLGPRTPDRGDYLGGPVKSHACCSDQRAGRSTTSCTAAQLEQCSTAEFQGIEFFSLGAPYDVSYGHNGGTYCNVAAKDGLIVAVWTRHWD